MRKRLGQYALALLIAVSVFAVGFPKNQHYIYAKTLPSKTLSPETVGHSSYNTSFCEVNQNKDVLSAVTARPSKNAIVNAILVTTPETHTSTPEPLPPVVITPVSEATPTAVPATTEAQPTPAPSGGLNADVMFNMINDQRSQAGLAALEKNDQICAITQSRGPELAGEIASGTMHAGFYNRHLPYKSTENMIYNRTEQGAVSWWLHSPIHRSAIFGDYKYSCISCTGDSCSQIFANL